MTTIGLFRKTVFQSGSKRYLELIKAPCLLRICFFSGNPVTDTALLNPSPAFATWGISAASRRESSKEYYGIFGVTPTPIRLLLGLHFLGRIRDQEVGVDIIGDTGTNPIITQKRQPILPGVNLAVGKYKMIGHIVDAFFGWHEQ